MSEIKGINTIQILIMMLYRKEPLLETIVRILTGWCQKYG